MSHGLVAVCAEGEAWVLVAQWGEHSSHNGKVVGLMPAQTFFQCTRCDLLNILLIYDVP